MFPMNASKGCLASFPKNVGLLNILKKGFYNTALNKNETMTMFKKQFLVIMLV